MKTALALLLLISPVTALAQAPDVSIPVREGHRQFARVPNLNGYWYLKGDPNARCEIRQEWGGRDAQFINEHGSAAWGTIRDNEVWIPDWSDGVHQGLLGTVVGDRILWPGGSYWSR